MTKHPSRLVPLAVVFAAGLAVAFGQTPTPLLTQPADKLIAVLKSDATQKEKSDACRQLAVVGTKDAVPALAALLADEQLNHMARFALEPILDPAVDEALRAAAGQLKGRPLVGVIGSLGVRRDRQATPLLAKLLMDPDADVAQAAARALGRIGDTAAAAALESALPTVSAVNQLAFCEGLFRCAEALAAKKQTKEALALYDRLRTVSGAPQQVRAGALRGAILTRGKDGLPLLREALRSQDYVLSAAACRTAMEMSGADLTKALLAELNSLPADKQILVIQTLGKRGDRAALPALLALAKTGSKPVRLAAIRALPEIGTGGPVPVLRELMSDADPELAAAAQESLAALPGRDVDVAVMKMLDSREPSQRLTAIDLVGRRRMTTALPTLLKAASDPDPKVRPAALKRVGELGGAAEVPALLDLLMRAQERQELDAAEQALSAVCTRADKPETYTEKLMGRWSQAQPGQKTALLSVLTAIGGKPALKAVREAVDDPAPEVHAAALRGLADWKTAEAAPELLALAQRAQNPTDRRVCLRGYLGWAGNADLPATQRLSMCQEAAKLIQQDEEKRLLLGALGSVKTIESVALIAPYLDDAATREEACAATVTIAEDLLKGDQAAQAAPRLVAPLQKAAQATTNADMARRVKAQLQRAQSRAGDRAQ